MAKIEPVARRLYEGLRPYVPKSKVHEYDNEFASRKMFTSKFVKEFFPKYVNFNYWIKKPKKEEDIRLLNYFIVEVPVLGVTWTKLLNYNSPKYLNKYRIKDNKK
ncbi:hypothetical protein V5097_07830 [Arenibacter palladensis]|uniref:hypothetical protein n=1 Tax=Arenibacter palladensis TaxID=237373 RepID=UPI002FCFB1FA